MDVGAMATSISVAIMVLTMLIFTDFRAADEKIRSEILWAALRAFQAGLMAYIILSPVTYEVENAKFVMACIITLVFCMACFAFEIDVDERGAKKLKVTGKT